ncbi:MAG TPA: RDD family protein [Dehalococcoidia bacterium]|nr:RDD family protein [Dehalococcoidia bacterium]HAS27859.1 RDD family protein [Dehalococcoidia bacterium]
MIKEESGGIVLEFAGFWRRFAAFAIDAVVLSVVSSIFVPFHHLGYIRLWNPDILGGISDWFILPQIILFNLITLIIVIGYFVIFWAWRGQTPGKIVMNIRVIRPDSSDITFPVAFLRYLGYIISAVPLFFGFIWIAFDKQKQGFHDKIAGTFVVIVPQPKIKATNTSPKVVEA